MNDIMSDIVLPVVFFIGKIIWTPIHWIFSGLKRFITDIAKGVYGKVVKIIVGLVVLVLIGYFIQLAK